MQLSGHVQAMDTSLIDGDAYYQLPIGEEKIDMNALLGQRIELKYNDAINCANCGIIIADTKFEFGLDSENQLTLMDEVLTPDSSRFWSLSDYAPGISPNSYDKQIIRDYLEALDWNKAPPAPIIPDEIMIQTADKYRNIQTMLCN